MKKIVFPFIAVILMVAVDQIMKLIFIGKSYGLLLFNIRYVENTGAAFGVLKGTNSLLILINLFIIFLIFKYRKHLKSRIGLLFILAGTFSNLMDRVFYGYVIDFIDFAIWPVFNIADVYIVIGVFLLIISMNH